MERVAIVGTAQSWTLTPWKDPGLRILSLNDAYRMAGFVRADEWYDTHPMDKFFLVPPDRKALGPGDIPPGHYVRPHDHREWLGTQTIPVWLHPQHATQYPPSATWRQAKPLPWADIEAHFGRYFQSGPALMMAHAMLRGAKEIHIYGIHLATQQEYVEQRPNFEYLLGRVLGPGKVTQTITRGVRRYETQDGVIVLPEQSPLLQAEWVYGLEDRPKADLKILEWDQHRYQIKRQRVVQRLMDRRWWQRAQPLRDELRVWDSYLADVQVQIDRRTVTWRADR